MEMTMKKAAYTGLLLALLVAISCQEATSAATNKGPVPHTFDCVKKCSTRCKNVKARLDRCLKYCHLCCNKCDGCVPSGQYGNKDECPTCRIPRRQYGNKDECPCYRDMKSAAGKPMCP